MTITTRVAVRSDAHAIATIRVRSWRAAYAGLVDPILLERLDIEHEARVRGLRWDQTHADPRHRDLIAHFGADPVGWAAIGPSRDSDAGAPRGELYAIYVLPEHWSIGAGHALITAAEAHLRAVGFRTAGLWMLQGNDRAGSFYERHGWVTDGAVKDDDRITERLGATPLRELRRVRTLADPHPRRAAAAPSAPRR